VVAGARETRRQMLLYTVMLWPASLAPWLLGMAGPVYGIAAGALSLLFTGAAIRVWRDGEDEGQRSARQMFHFSLLYLFLIFAFLLADRVAGAGQ
jgi:protoheme IX farnesyltransferase